MRTLTGYILLCCLPFIGVAQELCGTDFEHETRMQTDPAYRNHITDLQQQVRTIIENKAEHRSSRSVYVIPVVVHVIHIGEGVGVGTNISDSQIMAAIDGINDRWRNVPGLGADMEIEFCLASVDPDGNPTTGINRVDGSGVPNYFTIGINNGGSSTCGGANPFAIKDLSRWPVTQYYNIWVVNKICEGSAGYASYPNGGNYDGAVIRYNYMVSSAATPAHELGHGFFLYHTFTGDGGNLSCPDDNDCLGEGDYVCDTQPHLQGDCGAINQCAGNGIWDNSRFNYLSYCGTRDRFSEGQKERVLATLQVWPRSELLLNNICVASGINESSSASFSIFPNPASVELRIQNAELKIKEIEIYSSLTEKIFSQISNFTPKISIDVSQLTPGIYFIIVTDHVGNKVTRKVVKM